MIRALYLAADVFLFASNRLFYYARSLEHLKLTLEFHESLQTRAYQ